MSVEQEQHIAGAEIDDKSQTRLVSGTIARKLFLVAVLCILGYLGGASMYRISMQNNSTDPVDKRMDLSRALRTLSEEDENNCSLSNTDLLLPMHHKDMPLAASLFRSIELHLPCFKELVIVVPPESKDEITAVAPSWAKIILVPEPLPEQFGYLSQQVIKIYADHFTTGDYVLVLESDMVFTDWKDECFFGEGGKVRAFCVDFVQDKADPIWKKGTEHAIWRTVEHDCVVNTPFLYPKEAFSGLRSWVKEVHGKSFDDFMEDYYEGHSKGWTAEDKLFSEFNILNHYMMYFMEDKVELVKTSDPAWLLTGQCSSHVGGLVKRNFDLENPKLTSEYFALAYDAMKKPITEFEERTLDLSE